MVRAGFCAPHSLCFHMGDTPVHFTIAYSLQNSAFYYDHRMNTYQSSQLNQLALQAVYILQATKGAVLVCAREI